MEEPGLEPRKDEGPIGPLPGQTEEEEGTRGPWGGAGLEPEGVGGGP